MLKTITAVIALAALTVVGTAQVASANRNHDDGYRLGLTIYKEWAVAADPDSRFDEDEVDTSFFITVTNGHDKHYKEDIKSGDRIHIKPGSHLVFEETVTGLDENCEYSAEGLETDIVTDYYMQEHTVTNTVTCEAEETAEEDEGVVLSATTDEPKQVVAPSGAVNAGTGAAAVAATSALGMAGSVSALGYGIFRLRKRG